VMYLNFHDVKFILMMTTFGSSSKLQSPIK